MNPPPPNPPYVGMLCHYFRDPEGQPAAAIVTQVSRQLRVDLAIAYPNMRNFDVGQAIPHVSESDERGKTYYEEVGFWDYIPLDVSPKPRKQSATASPS
jgi:hypothetical protein